MKYIHKKYDYFTHIFPKKKKKKTTTTKVEEIGIPTKINKNRPGKKRRELERLFISQKRKKEKEKKRIGDTFKSCPTEANSFNYSGDKMLHFFFFLMNRKRCYIILYFLFEKNWSDVG